MGNTEEALIVANLGVPERGAKADGPWRRVTGTGWVRETRDHDYADAQRRGHPVTLLVTETTGALSPTFDSALRALGKHARAPTTHDSTAVGPLAVLPPHLPCTPSRGYLGSRRSRGRNYHTPRRSRHELQAHHGHVALLNRPRAVPAMV